MRSATLFAAALVGLLVAVAGVPADRETRGLPVPVFVVPTVPTTQNPTDFLYFFYDSGAFLTTCGDTITSMSKTVQSTQLTVTDITVMTTQIQQMQTAIGTFEVTLTTVTTTIKTVSGGNPDIWAPVIPQIDSTVVGLRNQAETLNYMLGQFTAVLEIRISNLPVISPLVPDIFIFQVIVKDLSFNGLINGFMNVIFVIRAQTVGVSYNLTATVEPGTTGYFPIFTGPDTILAVDVEAVALFAMELTLYVVNADGYLTATQMYLAEQPFGLQYCGFWVGLQPIAYAYIGVVNKDPRLTANFFYFGVYA